MFDLIREHSTINIIKNSSYLLAFFVGLDIRAYAILAIFIFIDTVTGVLKVLILHGGRHIKSSKLSAGVISKMLLLLVPLLVVWAGEGIGINLLAVAGSALSIFILSELYSILGNIYAIHTKKEVEEFDAVSAVLNLLRKSTLRLLNAEKKKISNDEPEYKNAVRLKNKK